HTAVGIVMHLGSSGPVGAESSRRAGPKLVSPGAALAGTPAPDAAVPISAAATTILVKRIRCSFAKPLPAHGRMSIPVRLRNGCSRNRHRHLRFDVCVKQLGRRTG